MAQSWAKKFYAGIPWQECRESFIANRISIDGALCQHCGKSLGYIVDHVIELTQENITDPMVSLNHENLQYLCHVCHNHKRSHPEGICREGYRLNDEGDLVEA